MRASTLPAGAGTAASSDGLALGRAAAHAGSGSPAPSLARPQRQGRAAHRRSACTPSSGSPARTGRRAARLRCLPAGVRSDRSDTSSGARPAAGANAATSADSPRTLTTTAEGADGSTPPAAPDRHRAAAAASSAAAESTAHASTPRSRAPSNPMIGNTARSTQTGGKRPGTRATRVTSNRRDTDPTPAPRPARGTADRVFEPHGVQSWVQNRIDVAPRENKRPAHEAVAQSLGAGSSLVCAVVGWVSDWAARLASTFSAGQRFRDRRSCVSEACAPEFEQVVGAGDQLPFGLTGGEAAAEEAVGAPDAFCVREDRFDDLLAFAVERLPFGCRQHRLDPLRLVALAG